MPTRALHDSTEADRIYASAFNTPTRAELCTTPYIKQLNRRFLTVKHMHASCTALSMRTCIRSSRTAHSSHVAYMQGMTKQPELSKRLTRFPLRSSKHKSKHRHMVQGSTTTAGTRTVPPYHVHQGRHTPRALPHANLAHFSAIGDSSHRAARRCNPHPTDAQEQSSHMAVHSPYIPQQASTCTVPASTSTQRHLRTSAQGTCNYSPVALLPTDQRVQEFNC